jgi:outer membrane protein TolC
VQLFRPFPPVASAAFALFFALFAAFPVPAQDPSPPAEAPAPPEPTETPEAADPSELPETPEDPYPVLTLESAIGQALLYNRDLLRQALEIDQASADLDLAEEEVRAFSVKPAGSLAATEDGAEGSAGIAASVTAPPGTAISFGAAATQRRPGEDDAWRRGEMTLEISQPLFRNFGSLVRNEPVELASDALRAARRTVARDRSALALAVVETYEGLLYLRHQIAADEAFAARMERLSALAEARERQGRASRTEVLRMDLQRGEADARLASGRAELEIQTQAFANLLGLPLDSGFRLVPPPLLSFGPVPPENALATAMRERPDYAQALDDLRIGERKTRLARRRLLPDIRLVARRTDYSEGPEWSDASSLDQTAWSIGLQGDLDLNRRADRLALRAAELDEESLAQAAEIVRYRLALDVNTALMDCQRARAELELAQRNLELAEGRAELARVLFAGRKTTANTVSDAESDCISTELSALALRRDASVAAYRLLHVLGTLVPADESLLPDPATLPPLVPSPSSVIPATPTPH